MLTPRRCALVLLPSTLLCACAAMGAAAGRRASLECGGAPLPAAWTAPGTVLLFGEVHGTRELPRAFGEEVCRAARAGPVLVGLELPRSEGARLTASLAVRGAAERAALLRASPYWTNAYQYGATSEAMAALLERLAELRAAGAAVEVFAFDEDHYGDPGRRDERMAATVAAATNARPAARTLVLTGNYHARTEPGAPWDPAMRFMGSFLRGAGLAVVGLDFAGEGTAWVCTAPDEAAVRHLERQVCGPTPWHGRAPAPGGLAVLAAPTPEGYAGVWGPAVLTASAPAVAR